MVLIKVSFTMDRAESAVHGTAIQLTRAYVRTCVVLIVLPSAEPCRIKRENPSNSLAYRRWEETNKLRKYLKVFGCVFCVLGEKLPGGLSTVFWWKMPTT